MVRPLKDQMTNDAMTAKTPLVVEVMGPAGAGKTTLSRALRQRHDRIAPDIDSRLSKLDKLPFVISNAFSLLPIYLRRYRHTRWFDRRETRSMAYLQAGLKLLRQEPPSDDAVVILDHGPIYRLAFLREFGPEVTTTHPYQRWWNDLLRQWSERLDIVIWLDAPSAVLVERVRARDCRHTIKGKSDQDAHEVLHRYRAAFERTIAESLAVRRVTVQRFDTSRQSTEEIVAEVLATLASASNAGQGRSETDERLAGASR